MEGKYIFALVILAVFLLLIFVSFVVLERGRIKDYKLQVWIRELYSSKQLNKYNYDAEGVEEIPEQAVEDAVNEAEDTDEEVAVDEPIEDPYAKIDIEGIEEITGNYNGDK